MRWVKYLFYASGIYGLLVITPQYFLKERIGRDSPPAITHPEYFYGFIGVALAWQIAFLIIGTDPLRYRPIILAGIVEKLSFGVAAVVLYMMLAVRVDILLFGFIDLLMAALFTFAWVQLGKKPDAQVVIPSPAKPKV